MIKQTEALKLALEALEKYCTPYSDGTHPADEVITALRQAIEQAEQAQRYADSRSLMAMEYQDAAKELKEWMQNKSR
jgi:hypothetical protein